MEYPSHTIQAYLRRQSNQTLEMTLEVFLPEEETDYTRFIIREIQTIFWSVSILQTRSFLIE